ncbi:porphobilinogen synthase, partial [Candidatus Aerophobetes bacterium]|nr:porphobilinogen synthase [Candidatus Aerophobetes bacterium]
MHFPDLRLRRLREKESIRNLVRETHLLVDDLVYPLFLVEGSGVKEEISSLPGQYHLSVDKAIHEAKEAFSLGIQALLIFAVQENKDRLNNAFSQDGPVQRAVTSIKEAVPELTLITDVCCCSISPDGHCGIVKEGRIDNDASISFLSKIALSHARAGADFVAPSAMMDGQVRAIRRTLDTHK